MINVCDTVIEMTERMGLHGLSFDAANMIGISFDALAVGIYADPDLEEITFFLNIGAVPSDKENKAAVYAYLLKNNNFARNTGGGVLGVDEEEASIYFSSRIAAGSFTAAELGQVLEAFLNLAESFIEGINNAMSHGSRDTIQYEMRV
jgi:Tir chaperone protein (CesT).